MKPKIGRNDLCPCGSAKKYKRCCGDSERVIAQGQDLGLQPDQRPPAAHCAATRNGVDELEEVSTGAVGLRRGDVAPAGGDPAEAESSLLVHLALYECLGKIEGMAAAFNNLGVVYQTLGDLVPAEAMYQEALKLEEELDCKEAMAAVCENLGQVYQALGNRVQAEAMYKKSAAQAKWAHARSGLR